MLKERLKELDIKITELANYLDISRPTMYKFIECYDANNKSEINKKILKLFDYINDNPLIGKNNIINYILNNLAVVKELEAKSETDTFKDVRKYIINNPDSEKSKFINLCCQKSSYDTAIHYLIEITPLLKKKQLTDKEVELLKPYKEIIELYTVESEDK